MKRKSVYALFLLLLLSAVLTACGNPAVSADISPVVSPAPSESYSFTDWLPRGVEQVMAETEPNPALENAIINYYEIPAEYRSQTKYYYNYVDLNGDGTDEILAVVMGPYTSGTGGDAMLWVIPNADMAVAQSFTLINTPIVVTHEALNGEAFGARGLIVQRKGGGAKNVPVLLSCVDGNYTQVNEGQEIDWLKIVKGKAIICNDLIADAEKGNYHTLGD